jgi:hypothetical protein
MTQTGVTVNFTFMLIEQADHLAHVLATARAAGAEVIEPTATAEGNWVAEIHRLANRPGGWNNRYLAEARPASFNETDANPGLCCERGVTGVT